MEILGRERRRRWVQAEKLEIVAAVGVNGETLARVARRYDVSRSQIYNWRHQLRKKGLLPAPVGPTFLPVDIGAPMLNAQPALEDRMASAWSVDAFDGRFASAQAHGGSLGRGHLRTVGREPVLPVLLRGAVLPTQAADGSLIDDALAGADRP